MTILSSIETLNWDDLLNRGLLYGDGVFETIRLVGGQAPLWQEHWRRLKRSADQLKLNLPEQKLIQNHMTEHAESNAMVKLLLFRKAGGRGYAAGHSDCDWVLQFIDQAPQPLNEVKLAIAELRLSQQKALAGVKHLSRLEQVLLANELTHEWTACDIDELLVLDSEGRVVECVNHNIIWVHGDELYTPDLSQAGVQGVGLSVMQKHFDIQTVRCGLTTLSSADAVVIVNSIRGIQTVSHIQGLKNYATKNGITDKMKALWHELMNP